jgi:glycosyltransferase involved in cell wall biosynthesis
MIAQIDSSAMWRIMQPINYIASKGYPCSWDYGDSVDAGAGAVFADLVILPRMMWQSKKKEKAYVGQLQDFEKTVVWECDDDLFTHRSYMAAAWNEEEKARWSTWVGRARRIVRRSDALFVSVPRLKTRALSVVRQGTPIFVVPNLIDLDWWAQILNVTPRTTEGLTVGWVGAKRNKADLGEMLEAWRVIVKERPDVQFVTAGYDFDVFDEVVPDGRRTHVPWMPLEEYPAAYKQVDIGCAPLAPTLFNGCKSPIKVMEYAAAGASVVASPTVFADHFSPEGALRIANNVDEWTQHLLDLIDNEAARKKAAEDLFGEVYRSHSLEMNYGKVVESWYTARVESQARRKAIVHVPGG